MVVKDLSRFGREYIDSGKYIERLFPALGVRFIAVNDHIDSKEESGRDDIVDAAGRGRLCTSAGTRTEPIQSASAGAGSGKPVGHKRRLNRHILAPGGHLYRLA